MTLDLSRIEFANDAYSYEAEFGTLVFYVLDENPPLTGVETSFKKILITLVDTEGESTMLSSVIGLEQNGFKIQSDYIELEGSILTLDNIDKCTMETPE